MSGDGGPGDLESDAMNPNSALLWLPVIEAAGLPTPKTIVVPYSHRDILPIFDGQPAAEAHRLANAVHEAATKIGYPVFLRTDLSSAKHGGRKAWCAGDETEVGRAVYDTLEYNEMAHWMEPNGQPRAFLVRQFLDLPAPFTAFHGLPISNEWRFFADENVLICAHPYWPEEALEEHLDAEVANWRELLRASIGLLPGEAATLGQMAVDAATACGGGRWSVDFAKDREGKWWLLDMARMESSWHWPGCPNGGKQ